MRVGTIPEHSGAGANAPNGSTLVAVFRQLVSAIRRLVQPPVEQVLQSWLHCPICDAELVGPYPAGAWVARSPGPTRLDPTRAELIAKCPVHGHAPYNDASKQPPIRRRRLGK